MQNVLLKLIMTYWKYTYVNWLKLSENTLKKHCKFVASTGVLD